MSILSSLTSAQLIKAAKIKDQITKLEKQLSAIFSDSGGAIPGPVKGKKKKGGMSAAGRARIAAAQKARWAKIKGAKAKTSPKPAKKKGGMSAAGRARIAAAQKVRWAKVKASKKAVK